MGGLFGVFGRFDIRIGFTVYFMESSAFLISGLDWGEGSVGSICVCACVQIRLYGTLVCWRESIPVYNDEPYAYIGIGDERMIYSLR